MIPEELKARTKAFALRIVRLVTALPKHLVSAVIGKQILRSGTSVGANYRAACRARSRAEFASRIAVVEEEADETLYWLELLVESGQMKPARLTSLMKETGELVAIAAASHITAKSADSRRAR
ncbi:MAG: four helix bundle protein [Planctomycetes bacterium]|nr:four helix bundle protein [Planctomycetota bacterium]